jgi:exonuclease SbcC
MRAGEQTRWKSELHILRDGNWKRFLLDEEVDPEIERITGFDYNSFLNSVVIRQGEVFSFIDAKDFERRDLLFKLLNIELKRFREYIKGRLEEIEHDIDVKKNRLLEKRSMLTVESIEELKSKLSEYRERVKRLNTDIKKLEDKIKALRERKMEIIKKQSALESIKEMIEKKVGELRFLSSRISGIGFTGRLEDLDEIEELFSEVDRYQKELEKIKDELTRYMEKLGELEKLSQFKSELEKLIRDSGAIEEELTKKGMSSSPEFANSLIEYMGRVKANLERLNDSIEILMSTEEPKCPICGREMSEEHKNKVIENLKRESKSLETQLKDVQSKIEVIKRSQSLLKPLNERIGSLKTLIEDYEKKLMGYKREEIVKKTEVAESQIKRYRDSIKEAIASICSFFKTKCGIENIEEIKASLKEYRRTVTEIDL